MSTTLPRDIQAFLRGYQGNGLETSHVGESQHQENLEFYQRRLKCRPDGLLIDEILTQWQGNYQQLEFSHGYIQWLFPIQEDGMNLGAQRLMPQEISTMKANESVMHRLLDAYRMMLDFYGMQLQSEQSGLLGRALPPGDYSSRYRHLLRAPHNNLRITRILKCLSELGHEHLNAGFILHVLNEQSEHAQLKSPFILDSMDRWWANCIRDNDEREWVRQTISQVRTGKLVFTREMYEKALEDRTQKGSFYGK